MGVDSIEVRLARLEGGYEQISQRLGRIEEGLDKVDARVDTLEARLLGRMDRQFYWLLGVLVSSILVLSSLMLQILLRLPPR